MDLSNYTKVRLIDSEGLNGETAWAYGMRKTQYNYEAYNLRLILDSKLSAKLVKKGNLSKFVGKKILVSAGEIEFVSLQEDDHSVWLEGRNLLTGEIKKYSDFTWIAKKSGYSKQDIELYFG